LNKQQNENTVTKIRLTKEFKFEMAHALKGYDGPCRNIHGHSYELVVTVAGEPISDPASPKSGMVMDFGQLKAIVRQEIVEEFDHALVLNKSSANEYFPHMSDLFGKLILVDYQPTSENMLIDFSARIKAKLPTDVDLVCMRLHETVTSYAEWFASDNQ
jgi:6-pyruvoyltetrahydropterin/6-carboxytetrahydropterin synthase